MSPSVSIDPRHSRSTSTNGGAPLDIRSNTKVNGMEGTKGGHVYSHIDDIMSVRPQVDINSSIRKILQDADLLSRQADTHLDFRRPELALQEYLQASIIVAETIPRHKDYPDLQTNNGDLHRAHTGLMKRIKAQDPKFDAVIKTIKENNLANNTRSKRDGHSDTSLNGAADQKTNHGSNITASSSVLSSSSNGLQGRKKPPVQPKPEGLHGRALQASNQPAAQSQISQIDTDLATRFAKLRGLHPQNAMHAQSAMQDSRIRTQPILIPSSVRTPAQSPSTPRSAKGLTTVRPAGPRELPSVPSSIAGNGKIALDLQIPSMPKPPDAIYSPASSADAASINLPSSVTRSSSYLGSTKNTSAPPISKVVATPTPTITDNRSDYFSPAHKIENGASSQNVDKRNFPDIPNEPYVDAVSLFQYLGLGTQTLRLLIIDLRNREEFDGGHIMAQAILCIEPITIREGMSAEDIGESMVLSPDADQKLYEKRHEFDLVVFYDQSSLSLNSGGQYDNNYMEQFSKAVYDYGYEKQLRRRPMFLRGGLDAWVDLMGPRALKTSDSSFAGVLKPAGPLGRFSVARDFRRNPPRGTRQPRPYSRPFSKEEETKWDETIKDEANNKDKLADADSEEFSYARTTEDFFRKYPELPSIQESMISSQPRYSNREGHHEFDAVIPRPPARPAPALPRQRSSGISEKSPIATYAMTSTANSITPINSKAGLTGLQNTRVTCYVNSVIQCLSATPVIRLYLLNQYTYPQTPHPPAKGGEQGPPPQLLTRNLTNLLRILWSGQYDWVMPKTFLNYVNALYAKKMPFDDPRDGMCGTNRQHDAHEFLAYIFDVILDELNVRRDKTDYQLTNPDPHLHRLSTIQSCIQEWKRYEESHQSALSNKFSGLVCETLQCANCPYTNRQFTRFEGYNTIYFPSKYHPSSSNSSSPPTRVGIKELLEDTMNFGRRSEEVKEWRCETCGLQRGIKSTKFAYLPEYLVFHFSRFGVDLGSSKIKTHIDLSKVDIDMGPFHITADDGVQTDPSYDAGFQQSQKYEVYAAAMHQGSDIKAGHYVALTRNPESSATGEAKQWHVFNDKQVYPGSFRDLENAGFAAAVLFLRRKP